MKYKEIAAGLRAWAVKNSSNRNKWSQNSLGITIKEIVKDLGNWKNAPRGNPRKGYIKMMENKNKQLNSDW